MLLRMTYTSTTKAFDIKSDHQICHQIHRIMYDFELDGTLVYAANFRQRADGLPQDGYPCSTCNTLPLVICAGSL